MDSVNLALQLTLKRANVETAVDYYYPHIPNINSDSNRAEQSVQNARHGVLDQSFRSAHTHLDEIMNSGVILYWGDFLHMAQYHRTIARRLILEKHVQNEQEAANYIQDIFFLSRAGDAVLNKTMSFGGTVIFNTVEDELHGNYATEFKRFIKRTHKIWSRDVFSFIKLSHLSDNYSYIRPGVDCALLIRKADVQALSGSADTTIKESVTGKIGVFFGRSRGTGFRLMQFASSIARGLGQGLYWLPWGNRQGFPSHRTWLAPRPTALSAMPGCEQLGDTAHLLSALMHSSLVITDTYHVAVNAWNLGTPAICVGDPAPFEARNVNSGPAFSWRDKRQTFLSMYDALSYFVYTRELQSWSWSRKRVQHILHSLSDEQAKNEIVRRMHQHRDRIETELTAELIQYLS